MLFFIDVKPLGPIKSSAGNLRRAAAKQPPKHLQGAWGSCVRGIGGRQVVRIQEFMGVGNGVDVGIGRFGPKP